jgi:transposase
MTNLPKSTIENRYKIVYPKRNQTEFQMFCLDDLIPEDHKVRDIWEFVEKMDIDVCYEQILSFQGIAGRSTTSPLVLLCIWIYAIMDGVISARKIEELCTHHNVYRWIAGGVPINRTMLSEFRSHNPEKFEELLISCLAVMVQANVLSDQDFSQDGTKVKANAGFNSFRREETLETLEKQIKQRIDDLEAEIKENPQKYDNRTQAAKKRAIKDRFQRIDAALDNLKKKETIR